MGVPKFYRWISERYPCLSEVIKEYQVPEFDNMYLDMNGIIHVCSHPNDDDPHFRISEEQIFADICHYIDFLFKIIKPKKVFFMAVDGVAPRAKMNQQRGRRFRTARDAEILEQKAKESGETLPDEARFDSNCITPGTAFMARLNEKLKSFVNYKISSDKLWLPVRVYLSGHETPGEGEHKIMDFIRYEKSQPAYDPNTRHCVYGLDADLIMLGLSSHEPHFSLLREEVRFGGKKNQKRTTTPEETTFHLLHLSLMREYLGYEFSPVKEKLPFEFELEKIIDDFVLMSFLVGNDFIPHLPQLHIHHDALPVLYKTYMDALPALGGYINEGGFLNLERFEMFLTKLAEFDYSKFSEGNPNFKFFENKSSSSKNHESSHNHACSLDVLRASELDSKMASLFMTSVTEVEDDFSDDDDDESLLSLEFTEHKKDYYCTKLEYDSVTPDVLREQAEGYVRAIQWNLHYYYNGIASWSWYYPHHYSPYISDVKNFKNMKVEFDIGKPFLPFQQLLAVLPAASKSLLPASYQKLMCDPMSPLIDFYPSDFQTDLNGKQQEWEALVLIPFINEKLLLKCAAEADKSLNSDEIQRNRHGPHLLYTYSEKSSGQCPSFLPGYFPDIPSNHAKCTEIEQDYFRLPAEHIKKGLCEGVILEALFPGFPTLKHVKHTAELRHAKVRVFQSASHRENMILTVLESVEQDVRIVANDIFSKSIYVNWPHLQEAYVVAVSDGKVRFQNSADETGSPKLVEQELSPNEADIFKKESMSICEYYYHRLGIDVGAINILVHANTFMGSKLVCTADGSIQEEKQWSRHPVCYALQVIVRDIAVYCAEFKRKVSLTDVFCVNSPVFMLGNPFYGCMGEVVDNDIKAYRGRIIVRFGIPAEPNLWPVIKNRRKLSSVQYVPGYIIAQQLGLKSMFVSRLTGTFLIQTSSKESISPNRINIGLNLKFNAKNEEVDGFTKRGEDGKWLYSDHVLKTLREYVVQFPDLFEKLDSFLKENVVYLEDMYPDGSGQEVMREVSKWLKSQQCSSAERQACGIDQLDEGIVRGIEEATRSAQVKDNMLYKETDVKPQLLYSPFFCKGCLAPDPGTTFQLFDRVVNVCSTSSVPLGLRGTVIGIRPAEKLCDYIYEVLFDKEFFGAISLKGSSKQGYRMSSSSLINISHGERLSRTDGSPMRSLKRWGDYKDEVNNASVALKVNFRQKGNRNALVSTNFGGQARQATEKSIDALDHPVMILKKSSQEQQQPSLPYSQPFYKTDVKNYAHELRHSPSSRFSPLGCTSDVSGSITQFVTPKAITAGASVNKNNVPLLPTPPPSSQDLKYENTWNDLLKKPKADLATGKQPGLSNSLSPNTHKVSVEELMQCANNQNPNSNGNSAFLLQPAVVQNHSPYPFAKSSLAAKLMDKCQSYFRQPPLYQYLHTGGINGVRSTVQLPTGLRFEGDICHDKFQACESAAGKALQHVSQFGFTAPRSRFPLPPQNAPPLFPFNPTLGRNLNFTSSVLRHPPPPSSVHIPHSFLNENKMFISPGAVLSSYGFPPSSSQEVFASHPALETDFRYKEVKNSYSVAKEPPTPDQDSVGEGSMFIPLQVSMNRTKKAKDNINQRKLSKEEWPGLSPNDTNDDKTAPADSSHGAWEKHSEQVFQNPENSRNSIAPCYQAKEHQDNWHMDTLGVSRPSSSDSRSHKTTRTKRRIAAKFSNP